MADKTQSSIEVLNNQIDALWNQEKYAQAIPLATQVCALTAQQFGSNHSEYAASLNMLAQLYQLTRNYTAAESLYQEIAEIDRVQLGVNHSQYAADLVDLADLYVETGDLLKAEPLYQSAIEIDSALFRADEETLLNEHKKLETLYELMREYSAQLSKEAEEHQRRRDYSAAEPLYQEIAEIQSRLQDHTRRQRNADDSLPPGSIPGFQPIQIGAGATYSGREQQLQELNELGLQYREMGRFAEAEEMLLQSFRLHIENFGENHTKTARALNNLAALYDDMGLYTKAAEFFHLALLVRKRVCEVDDPELAIPAANLADLFCQKMEEYAEAAPLYAEALRIQRKAYGYDHPHFVTTLNNVAVAFLNALGNRERLRKVEPLKNLLTDFIKQPKKKDFLKTLETAFRHILAVHRKRFGERHPRYAFSLNNLSTLFYKMGRYADAEPLIQQSIDICRKTKGEKHTAFANLLTNLAELKVATERPSEALVLLKEATTITDRAIGQLFAIGSEADREIFVGFARGIISDTQRVLSLVTKHLASDSTAVQTALGLVLRRKGIEAEAFAAQRDAVLGGRYPELEGKMRELSGLRTEIAQLTLAGPGEEGLEAHEQLLADLDSRKERIEIHLSRQIPEISLEQKFRTADREAVALALPDNTALIEFVRFRTCDFGAVAVHEEEFWKESRYVAFILHANKANDIRMVDLGEAVHLDRLIRTFRTILTEEDESRGLMERTSMAVDRDQEDKAGTKLRAALFDPLRKQLSDCKRLLVSPDGDLTRLPFEILPLNDGRRLIDEFRISYLTSGRDVLRFGERSGRKPGEPFVAADPDFDLSDKSLTSQVVVSSSPDRDAQLSELRELHFGRLPGTRIEGERVGAMLGITPLTEAEALESRLKASRSPRLLHLATHGFFLPNREQGHMRETRRSTGEEHLEGYGLENPLLRSGLALAGANSWLKKECLPPEAEDGILTAEDVSGLDLLDTELAVLSACETGLGEVSTGEGVLGLRRAFALAGAKTLVMSLWKVPDLSTAILMERFYINLLESNMERDEALRAAQLYVRDVSVRELRDTWLTEEMMTRLAASDRRVLRQLKSLAGKSDDYVPFTAPRFWGAFICQGDPGRIPIGE